jgi:hypothetical protein
LCSAAQFPPIRIDDVIFKSIAQRPDSRSKIKASLRAM